jgi:hypothetical protein
MLGELSDTLYRVDFFLLDCKAAASQMAGWTPICCAFEAVVIGESRSNYPVCTYHTPNTNFFIMKR